MQSAPACSVYFFHRNPWQALSDDESHEEFSGTESPQESNDMVSDGVRNIRRLGRRRKVLVGKGRRATSKVHLADMNEAVSPGADSEGQALDADDLSNAVDYHVKHSVPISRSADCPMIEKA